MFSGLTNQVSSWMGAAKGEPQDEEVPTPTKEATGEPTAEGERQSPTKGASKLELLTNVQSKMTGWLGSGIPIPGLRKNEAPADAAEPAPEPAAAEPAEPKPEKDDDDNSRYNSATGGADSRPGSTGGTPTEEQPQGVGNESSAKKLLHIDAIEVPHMQELTTKAVAGAKSLGNFLYSAVNKAGAKVSEASAKIKKTVEENIELDFESKYKGSELSLFKKWPTFLEKALNHLRTIKAASDYIKLIEENPCEDVRDFCYCAAIGCKIVPTVRVLCQDTAGKKKTIKPSIQEAMNSFILHAKTILGELNKEQDAFIKGQTGTGAAAVAPWIGAPNEAALKEECLSLSTDRRNFVRAPPAGVEFEFDYDKMYPVATAIMAEDSNLEKMRFDLVPKVITEENFWRNYFYRLSLICQANEADAVAAGSRQASADDSQDDKSSSNELIVKEKSSQESIEDAKQRIKSLKVDRENDDEQWEKELEAELNEYEVVAGAAKLDLDEKECEDLLGDEDLK